MVLLEARQINPVDVTPLNNLTGSCVIVIASDD